MNEFLGFTLLSHTEPEQTVFLCSRLSEQFGNPPIALHHNHNFSELPRKRLGSNVFVVEDFVDTKWADLSITEAFLRATRLLFRKSNPQWVTNLSTSDYPIKPAEQIRSELANSPFDAMFGHTALRYGHVPPGHVRDYRLAFNDPAYAEMGYDRYVAFRVVPSKIHTRLPLLKKLNFRGSLAEPRKTENSLAGSVRTPATGAWSQPFATGTV